jgi:phosphonate transport system substrate-binding protein
MSGAVAPGAGTLVMGAVAYDPKVVTIWDGFRDWLAARGLDFDYVLYSNYERQVEALMDGHLHLAWNSPLAWERARRLSLAAGTRVTALAMRDTDCDLTSVVVVRADSGIEDPAGQVGRVVGVGAVDSPQATLIPLSQLRAAGLVAGRDFEVRRHDIGVGKHGDHVGGERDAARALMAGTISCSPRRGRCPPAPRGSCCRRRRSTTATSRSGRPRLRSWSSASPPC